MLGLDSPTGEVLDSARRLAESLLESIPRVAAAAAIIGLGYALSRLLRWVLAKLLTGRQTPSFARVMSTSSFRAALQGDAEVTPGGGVIAPPSPDPD